MPIACKLCGRPLPNIPLPAKFDSESLLKHAEEVGKHHDEKCAQRLRQAVIDGLAGKMYERP